MGRALLLGLTAAVSLAGAGGAKLTLSSPAFRANHAIPVVYTCDGKNVSPPLRWTSPPRGTRGFALRLYDRDARFVHWLAWGIGSGKRSLARGERPPYEGRNDFGKVRYGPPCPPAGETHHYVFTLYALAKPLRLRRGAALGAFTSAIRTARVRAAATLVGTYRRR
jgi:Raf kinase inhibitor-like YbhB/YbcL family protein